MDTQKTINDLKTLVTSDRNTAKDLIARADANDILILGLEGTLQTQAIALEAQYQKTVDNLTTEKEDLVSQIAEKDSEIATLIAENEELKK